MWIFPKELEEHEKDYFIVVAKAIALSQRFENNLKSLAFEAEIIISKKEGTATLDFDELVESAKKNSKIYTMIKMYNKAYSDEDITQLFDKARIARNLIVHCSLEGCYSGSYGEGIPMKQEDILKCFNNTGYRAHLERIHILKVINEQLVELTQHVYDLAIGDFYAGIIDWNINFEHGNYPFNADGYAKRMDTWIFSSINTHDYE